MTDDQSQAYFREFVKFTKLIQKEAGYTKRHLAKKLEISYSHFSKVYNKKLPAQKYMVTKLIEIYKSIGKTTNDNTTNDKITNDDLPKDNWKMREEITYKRATQDVDLLELIMKLRERVSDLEKELERTKDASEKKIWAVERKFATALREKFEQLTDTLEPKEKYGS